MNEYEKAWLAKFELEQIEEAKKRKSTKATQYLCDFEARVQEYPQQLKYNNNKLYAIGGQNIVALYHNYANIDETCQELCIRQSTLRSCLYRLREKLNKLNISPLIFDKLMRDKEK